MSTGSQGAREKEVAVLPRPAVFVPATNAEILRRLIPCWPGAFSGKALEKRRWLRLRWRTSCGNRPGQPANFRFRARNSKQNKLLVDARKAKAGLGDIFRCHFDFLRDTSRRFVDYQPHEEIPAVSRARLELAVGLQEPIGVPPVDDAEMPWTMRNDRKVAQLLRGSGHSRRTARRSSSRGSFRTGDSST
jgi:hypothetical protein